MRSTLQIVLVALLVVSAPVPATAQSRPAAQVAYIGTGTLSCGKFVQYKEAENQAQLELFVQWVWGFMSAYTFRAHFVPKWQGSSRVGNIEGFPEATTVLLYLEKHRRDHPLDKVIDATSSLIQSSGGNVVWKQVAP